MNVGQPQQQMQQPPAQQPVAQQPMAQQPVAQQPVAQQPNAQQPMPGQSVHPSDQPKRDYRANPLTEQDRDQFDKLIVEATHLLHAPESRAKVLERIKGKVHPFKDVANAAVAVMSRLDQNAEKQGKPYDPVIRTMAMANITKQILELADASGKLQQPPTPEDMKLVFAEVVSQDQRDRLARGVTTKQDLAEEFQGAASRGLAATGEDPSKLDAGLNAVKQIQLAGSGGRPTMPEPEADPFKPQKTMKDVLAQKNQGQGGLLNG